MRLCKTHAPSPSRPQAFALIFCLATLPATLPALYAQQASPSDASQQAAEHTRKAQQYLRERQPQLAIPELRSLVALEPTNTDAQANLGVLLYFQNLYTEAIPPLQAALSLQPGLWRVQYLLGMSQKRTGDARSAAPNLEAAFDHLEDPKLRLQCGLELVETDANLGQLDKAAAIASQLRSLAPEDPLILSTAYQIYSQLAGETLLSLVTAAPASAEMHMALAHEYVHQGRNDAALEQYRKALAINPAIPGLHFELAELLHNSSDPALQAQAEAEYKAALSINRFDEKALCGLASIASARGDLHEAERLYSQALVLQPNDSDAQTSLAKVLLSLNDRPKALSLLEQAIRTDPTNATAHYRLSTLYRQMGRPADAKQQLDLYQHYSKLKEDLRRIYQQKTDPNDAPPAASSATSNPSAPR